MYFPLVPRLRKLLGVRTYWDMCQHEFLRPRNEEYITDIYDAPGWKEFMGPPTYPNRRLGFVYCIDSFPVNNEGSKSTAPGGFMNASLPPTERGKVENMLISIVFPTSVKGEHQRKYYNFMASYELNGLYTQGVDGLKVKIFTTSMDTPGRAELMGALLYLQTADIICNHV